MTGLSRQEVIERTQQGRVNRAPKTSSDSYMMIVKRHLLTIFNLMNLVIAVMILAVSSYRNLLFLGVAVLNTLIGIINEVRAKRVIDKLKLISETGQRVIRDGTETEIPGEEIVEGDLIRFGLGSQIVVDAEIAEGTVSVNESFISGESDTLIKSIGDRLFSGSFITSGECLAVVTAVGPDHFINTVAGAASEVKASSSKLFSLMNTIIRFLSYIMIPVGGLLLISQCFFSGVSTKMAVTSTAASLISMIPQGLVLLISSVLALSALRLAKNNILVQDLYAIETLARVDAICLDKTGTLTTGQMRVREVIPYGNHSKSEIDQAVSLILKKIPADNATSKALLAAFGQASEEETAVLSAIPFSSEHKYSGVRGENGEILMGAIEMMTDRADFLAESERLADGSRWIAVMKKDGNTEDLLGFIRLEDEIRKDAADILKYFQDNQVTVFVISGDALSTVTAVAESVGLSDVRAIDLSALDAPDYDDLIRKYCIFSRVTPLQKKELVHAMKQAGYTVAMTGDGVNDVLAMKEADCSIAVGDGTDAARRVARLVLLDSDFSVIPMIIAEGRKTINNLERSATLFLSKTTFATLLSVLFVVLPLSYPFIPIGMSFMNFVCIGFPAFVLALEPNYRRIKNQFVHHIAKYALPTGIVIALNTIGVALTGKIMALSFSETATIAMMTTLILSLFLVFRISRPLNRLRIILFILLLLICLAVFAIPFIRNFFGFVIPDLSAWCCIAVSALISLPLSVWIGKIGEKTFEKWIQKVAEREKKI